jgi:hypothetical protein
LRSRLNDKQWGGMSDSSACNDLHALERGERGREKFRVLLRRWMARSSWTYAALAGLAEQAVRDVETAGIPDWGPGLVAGQLFQANGHIWQLLQDPPVGSKLPTYTSSSRPTKAWDRSTYRHVAPVRRIFGSQVNNLLRGQIQSVYAVTFDTLGVLNGWIADVKAGRRPRPTDRKLALAVETGQVLQDEDGIFGPEEFLSIYLDRLGLPPGLTDATPDEAAAVSTELSRRIRAGMQTAGLDLVDDWPQFVAVYPTSNAERLQLLRDVALGLQSWPAQMIRDEEAAVAIALQRLATKAAIT